jgi:hypothetical protein
MTLPIETARFDALRKLAVERYGKITPAEESVLHLSASTEGFSARASKDRPEVRAAFLRWLVTDKEASPHIDPLGLRVLNTTITSALDLDFCKIAFPLLFVDCTLRDEFSVRSAELPALNFFNCTMEGGITADGLCTQASVLLRKLAAKGEVRLLNARIGGDLDCSGAILTAARNALFADGAKVAGCVYLRGGFSSSGTIRFLDAQIGGDLDCSGATLTGEGITLWAERAKIDHSVFLSQKDGEKFSSSGEMRIFGAQIGGDLDCRGAILTAKGPVLSADRAEIKGTVFLSQRFTSLGTARFTDAQIRGDLDCSRATLSCYGDALHADRANITGSVILIASYSSGKLYFPGAQIGGDLYCSGAILTAKDDALIADEARIKGKVCLRKVSSTGTISLLGTQIGGDLDCLGAALSNAKGAAFIADRANVAGGVFFIKKFSSSGEIRLLGAQIGGDLNCSGATLTAKENALYADEARITGSAYFVDKFSSEGTIRLPYAEIGGNLDCSGATLTARQNTLYADEVKIGHSVFLRDGFSSSATVRFNGAKIGGDLDCSGALIGNLECKGTQASGNLIWRGIRRPEVANNLDLSKSSFTRLLDDRASWPLKGHLSLGGLVYQDLVLYEQSTPEMLADNTFPLSLKLTSEDRIVWLKRQPDGELNNSQPWMQVAKLLEANGDSDGAKHVLYELRRQQACAANPRPRSRYGLLEEQPLRIATFLYDRLEEQPLRVSYPILLLWLFGSVIFWRAHRMKAMVPSNKDAYEEFRKCGETPEHYIPFSPAIYALENVLPVVKLGQDDAWRPNPDAKPASWFPHWKHMAWTGWLPGMNYPWLATLRWTLILLGWALALILGAAISERFRP